LVWDAPALDGDDGGLRRGEDTAPPLQSREFDLAGVRAEITIAQTQAGWAAVTLEGTPHRPALLAYDFLFAGEHSAVKAVIWEGRVELTRWLCPWETFEREMELTLTVMLTQPLLPSLAQPWPDPPKLWLRSGIIGGAYARTEPGTYAGPGGFELRHVAGSWGVGWAVAKQGAGPSEFIAFCPDRGFARPWRIATEEGFDTDFSVEVAFIDESDLGEAPEPAKSSESSALDGPLSVGVSQPRPPPRMLEALDTFVLHVPTPERTASLDRLRCALRACEERWAAAGLQLRLKVQVVRAVDTRGADFAALPPTLRERLFSSRPACPDTLAHFASRPGALGCALSHMQLLSNLSGPAVVFEDDALVVPDRLAAGLPQVLAETWDLCLLGWSARRSHDVRCLLNPERSLKIVGAALAPVAVFYRTHAYVARPAPGLRGFLPLRWELDTELSQRALRSQLCVCGLVPCAALHPGHDGVDAHDYEWFVRPGAGTTLEAADVSTADSVATNAAIAAAVRAIDVAEEFLH